MEWQAHIDDAYAILRTLREPDEVMAAAGDVITWEIMVTAALEAASTWCDMPTVTQLIHAKAKSRRRSLRYSPKVCWRRSSLRGAGSWSCR